jgi:integrase
MEDWIREGLTRHAAHWQLALALAIQREQRRRNSAVRQLRWSDIDLEAQTVRWRPEHDKRGKGNVTPLSNRAADELRKAPSRGIGETPVFPSAVDSAQPTSRNTTNKLRPSVAEAETNYPAAAGTGCGATV